MSFLERIQETLSQINDGVNLQKIQLHPDNIAEIISGPPRAADERGFDLEFPNLKPEPGQILKHDIKNVVLAGKQSFLTKDEFLEMNEAEQDALDMAVFYLAKAGLLFAARKFKVKVATKPLPQVVSQDPAETP